MNPRFIRPVLSPYLLHLPIPLLTLFASLRSISLLFWLYEADLRSSSALSVFSQVNVGSLRPKCP